jgi:6-phosphogluconolactonase (cycloisomerase 2 family)
VVPNLPVQVIPEPSGRFAYLLAANAIVTGTIDPTTGILSGASSTLSTSLNSNQGVVDPTGRYLYVASSGGVTTSLDSYRINLANGSLTRIGSSIPLGSNLSAVITDSAGKFLYATDGGSNKLFAFSIGADGTPTPLTVPSYTVGNLPLYPAIDAKSSTLYVPNFNDNSLSALTINADGSLTAVAGSPFTAGNGPTQAAVDAAGKFLFVTNENDGTVSGFAIQSGGGLGAPTSVNAESTGSVPFGIAIDPSNSEVAVTNFFGNSISLYSLNASSGALTPAALPQVEAPAGPLFINFGIGVTSLTVNPGAVYAANAGSGDISAFLSTPASGVLTAATGSPFPGVMGNSFLATNPQGSLLFAGGFTGTSLEAVTINQSTGAPTSLSGSPFSVTGTDLASGVYLAPTSTLAFTMDVTSGSVVSNSVNAGTITGPGTSTPAFAEANNLAADPQGDILYALGLNATNGIQPFTVDTIHKTLTAQTQTALPGNWTSGAVDASGQFFVAVDSTAKSLQAFMITPVGTALGTDGSLTAVATSGTVNLTGTGPWVIAIDPQDRVVFVADQTAGTITPYAFDATTGALGAAGAATTALANGIANVTTDIAGNYLYAGEKAAIAPGSKGAVAVYSIGANGALTPIAGSPFTTGTGNSGVVATSVIH